MSEKTCLLLSILLISVLFFPLTTAGRVLQADTPEKENYETAQSGNGGSKIRVRGHKSKPDQSATGQSSPSQASPTRTSSRATIPRMGPSTCTHIPVKSGSCDTSPRLLASTREEPPSRLPQSP